jgi:hypothetical protein
MRSDGASTTMNMTMSTSAVIASPDALMLRSHCPEACSGGNSTGTRVVRALSARGCLVM